MGHQQSKNQILKYQQNYSEIQKQQHPFLGTITHLSHNNNATKHFLKIFKYATDHEINLASKKANKRKQLSQKKGSIYIIKTTEVQTSKQNQLCGMTHYLYIVYEDYQASLGDLIRQKKQSNQIFSQDEILEFIRNLCNGLIFLQDNGYTNYAITKESIVKSYKDASNISNYKLFDTDVAKEMLPYPKLMNGMGIQKGIYMSPEALQEIINKNIEPELSLKSQIFSIGMVALEMCLLEPLDYLYDYNRLKLHAAGLSQRIKNLKNYSPYLRIIIQQMLEANQQQRIGAVSLRQKVSTNDNKSTTDNGYSAIGNSNVTQRTHKISYPLNSVNALNVRQASTGVLPHSNQLISNTSADNINKYRAESENRNLLTVDQLKNQSFQPVSVLPTNQNMNKKNQTFDQIIVKPYAQHYQFENNQKNISIDRYRLGQNDFQAQQKKRIAPVPNYPFYVPHHLKPVTMNILHNNVPTLNNTPREFHHSNQPQIQIQPILPNQNLIPLTINDPNEKALSQNSNPIKIQQIQIPDLVQDKIKNHPETPINYLNQSNPMFASQPQSFKNIDQRGTFIEQLQVLTSVNAGFKKSFSVNEQNLNQNQSIKNEYESPNRRQQLSCFASNDSTPIRKVQALQSAPRNSFDQIIKQALEQNQIEAGNFLKKIISKPAQREEMQNYGPKTYGRHHFTNGALYEGQFDGKGNFCGNGILYYPNGKVCYSGGWMDNSFHGFGVLNNETVSTSSLSTNYENFNLNDSNAWHHYEGEFFMDKKNGFGSLYMTNGDKFSGSFVKDAIQGYGTFTNSKGEKVSGIWHQNILKKF